LPSERLTCCRGVQSSRILAARIWISSTEGTFGTFFRPEEGLRVRGTSTLLIHFPIAFRQSRLRPRPRCGGREQHLSCQVPKTGVDAPPEFPRQKCLGLTKSCLGGV
jgi:hypothetical protein